MKIGIAARGLDEKSGGVKRYIFNLIRALLKIDRGNTYVIYYNKRDFVGTFPNACEIVLDSGNKLIWDFILLPAAIRRDKVDVVLFPKNVLPFFVPCKSVVVNHDYGYFIRELDEYKFFDQFYMKMMMPISARRADGIISISEHTKRDIIKFTGVKEDKIAVIHLAADENCKMIEEQAKLSEVRYKYGLDFPFIFHCGSLSPRKNIARLIKAFNLIRDRIPHQLVFTAGKSWKDTQINELVAKLRLDSRIVKLGHIGDGDMPAIYNLADLYVYPSIYEGFGLPVLEAMACGCLVVTSNATSLPEVAGDAAIMVDPLNVEQLSQAMYAAITDEILRQKLIEKGFTQAGKFSWEKTAYKTLEVFKKVNYK